MCTKERMAFLVIHGIGEQNPFETLDSFVRNFWKMLKKNNPGSDIAIKHSIQRVYFQFFVKCCLIAQTFRFDGCCA